MLTNFPNGVASFGMPVLGPMFTTGQVFFVGSGADLAADDLSHGRSPTRPFRTLGYAAQRVTANNGDVIICMPGHSEDAAAAGDITFAIDGVDVIGLGYGSARPTINFTTATTASVLFTAANITLANVLFTGGIDDLTQPLDIQGADVRLLNFETRDVTGEVRRAIYSRSTANRLHIEGWVHRGAAGAGSAQAIRIEGGANAVIIPRFIDGNFSTAVIENVTTAATNLRVRGSASHPAYIRNRNASDVIFTAAATTTGAVGPFINARLADNAANITESFVGADMEFFQPINIVNNDGESSMELNITASTDA